MTSDEVLRLVETEIGGEWDRPTSHHLDLRRSVLRPPRKAVLQFDPPGLSARRDVWLVVIERPGDESGYWVFYDSEGGKFGLATAGADGRFHHVGTYGSLWDTLEGM